MMASGDVLNRITSRETMAAAAADEQTVIDDILAKCDHMHTGRIRVSNVVRYLRSAAKIDDVWGPLALRGTAQAVAEPRELHVPCRNTWRRCQFYWIPRGSTPKWKATNFARKLRRGFETFSSNSKPSS